MVTTVFEMAKLRAGVVCYLNSTFYEPLLDACCTHIENVPENVGGGHEQIGRVSSFRGSLSTLKCDVMSVVVAMKRCLHKKTCFKCSIEIV
jgi:hypothetical protein